MNNQSKTVYVELESRTLIRDEYRAEFFALSQPDQLKTLVRRAVIDVYGSSWTTPESRQAVAEAASTAQASWDSLLAQCAREHSFVEALKEFIGETRKHEQTLIDGGLDTIHVSRSRTLQDSILTIIDEHMG